MGGNIALLLLTIPKKKLSRYEGKTGVFLIRLKDEILYLGKSKNLYEAISRLFHHGGSLESIDSNRVTFEILLFYTWSKCTTYHSYFKTEYSGKYNYIAKAKPNFTKHHQKQKKLVLEEYRSQSIFYMGEGEHKSDED